MDFSFPGHGYSSHTYRSPDGRFSFSSATYRGSFPPRQGGAYSNPMVSMLQTLQTILTDISNPHDHQPPDHHVQPHGQSSSTSPRQHSSEQEDLRHDEFPDVFRHLSGRGGPSPVAPMGQMESLAEYVSRLHRRYPRVLSRPPIDHDIDSLLDSVRRTAEFPNHGLILSALLRDIAEMQNHGRFGDAVYSREALDEVIAQLGQQDEQRGGPPPASPTAIQSLPTKKIDVHMMDSDGKAECAICKDQAELGTEVTVLPCEHWFHFDCIEVWLSRHDTCPNCRQSIGSARSFTNSTRSPGEGTRDHPISVPASPEQPSPERRRRRSSPFSRSSLSSRSGRRSLSRTTTNSPTQETAPRSRRSSRSEGLRGGITGWVWSRFGGSSS